jgi:hypothetical protein
MSIKSKGPKQRKRIWHLLIITASFTYNDTNVETGKTRVNRKGINNGNVRKIVSELRDTPNASDDCVCTEAKKGNTSFDERTGHDQVLNFEKCVIQASGMRLKAISHFLWMNSHPTKMSF